MQNGDDDDDDDVVEITGQEVTRVGVFVRIVAPRVLLFLIHLIRAFYWARESLLFRMWLVLLLAWSM